MAAAVLSRATPAASLSSSQAQTSAPVFEYRCMFTHDVRKKAKKWHDGSLRFHTFNKRVMVYDDTKNFVGSLHYRSQEDFTEGLELNLDSHVLVQVEDQLGETSTDLTPLLGRNQQDGTNQAARADPPTRATLSRVNAANSQIKPKSIKELLAGSQGQIGRARLPAKSPYEQTHPLAESQSTCPTPKRRKIDNGKENRYKVVRGEEQGNQSSALERADTLATPQNVVVDISSEDDSYSPQLPSTKTRNLETTSSKRKETSPLRSTSPKKVKKKKTAPAVSISKSKARPAVNDDRGSSTAPVPNNTQLVIEALKEKTSKRTSNDNPIRPHSAPSPTSRPPATGTSPPIIRHSSGPRSSLKFAAEKRRPKLMYRALLENSSKPVSIEPVRLVDDECDNERVIRPTRLTNLIEVDRMFAPSQIDRDAYASTTEAVTYGNSPSPRPDHSPAASLELSAFSKAAPDEDMLTPLNNDTTETVPDSPLFLPRTTSQVSPPQPRSIVVNDSHLTLSQALHHSTPRGLGTSIVGRRKSPVDLDVAVRSSPSLSSSPVFHRLGSVDEGPHQPVTTGMSPTRNNGSGTAPSRSPQNNKKSSPSHSRAVPTPARLFRRVVSEIVPPTRTSPDIASNDEYSDEEIRNVMLRHSPVQETSPRAKNLPTQPQSFSDPVDIHPQNSTPVSTSSSPDIEETPAAPPTDTVRDIPIGSPDTLHVANIPLEESGPWTSTEAFLLFDRWPPGRQKPSYAKATPLDTAAPGTRSNDAVGGNRNQQSTTNVMTKKKYGTFGSAKFVSQR